MESVQWVTLPVPKAIVDAFFVPEGSTVKRGQQVLRYEHVIQVTTFSQVERYAPFYSILKSNTNGTEECNSTPPNDEEDETLRTEYIRQSLEKGSSIDLKVRDFILSPFEGQLHFKVQLNDQVYSGDVLFEVTEVCGHSVQFSGMCAICGKDLSVADFHGTETYRAQINMIHDTMGITVSRDIAKEMDKETALRLRQEKKLSLILDLDQTLIHATADPRVGRWLDSSKDEGVFRFHLSDGPTEYFLKLRPGLQEFLSELQNYYELHIYTMGTRLYANQVAKIIDPEKTLFKERVLSRNESGSFHRKSLQRLFPCDQSMVVVIDDRGDVWDWTDNLIRVHPYSFFLKTGDINNPAIGPPVTFPSAPEDTSGLIDTLPLCVKSNDNDQELRILLTQLISLHSQFYEKENNDVRNILPRMKQKVLENCIIVFSGLIPKEITPNLWKLATSFGACCELEVRPETTHVVAVRWGTTKTKDAALNNIPIVTLSWLTTSLSYWKQQSVAPFLIPPNEEDLNVIKALQEELAHLEEEEFGMDVHLLLDVEAEVNAWINGDTSSTSSAENGSSESTLVLNDLETRKRGATTPILDSTSTASKKMKKTKLDTAATSAEDGGSDSEGLKEEFSYHEALIEKTSGQGYEDDASFSELLHDLDAELEVELEEGF